MSCRVTPQDCSSTNTVRCVAGTQPCDRVGVAVWHKSLFEQFRSRSSEEAVPIAGDSHHAGTDASLVPCNPYYDDRTKRSPQKKRA